MQTSNVVVDYSVSSVYEVQLGRQELGIINRGRLIIGAILRVITSFLRQNDAK